MNRGTMSDNFTLEQLELAKWLVANASSPTSEGFIRQSNVPADKGGPLRHSDHYTLAARIASTQTPDHFVYYLPEYQSFFFQPRFESFRTFKI